MPWDLIVTTEPLQVPLCQQLFLGLSPTCLAAQNELPKNDLADNRPSVLSGLYFLPRFNVPSYEDQFAVINMGPDMLQPSRDAAVMAFTVVVSCTCCYSDRRAGKSHDVKQQSLHSLC